MAEIKHLVIIDASPARVYAALTERTGLGGWWTEQVTAEPEQGSIATFDFGSRYHVELLVAELEPDRRVRWKCLEGDPEWTGTTLEFDLEPDGDRTIVRFTHGGWGSASDFFASCNYHWGFYMRSLRDYCETGSGQPFNE